MLGYHLSKYTVKRFKHDTRLRWLIKIRDATLTNDTPVMQQDAYRGVSIASKFITQISEYNKHKEEFTLPQST